ncbi:hypothetical protein RVR_P2101 (plasmid) [Actinacidiphila reveromycinica]|uniref:Centromere-binding protein ParB C-terminal domain-containing protein n=2 Tax=Actinacidiphila reveromycinica TaxID=659352 RepID=A0A7U3VU83_9ACTN|nr:hypothetical protein RVR_P2101 [Streptomyces sp. SN-593]
MTAARQAEHVAPAALESVRTRSFSMPDSLYARLRAAVWHTMQRSDGYYNLSQLVCEAVDAEVSYLETRYNRGRPFPVVGRLPSGPSPQGAVRGAQIRAERRAQARAVVDAATKKPPTEGRKGGKR